jgi:FKBP-type peptidyl-prolyl cis-trans isomerase
MLLFAYAVLERGLDWLHIQLGVNVTTIAGASQVLMALTLGVVGALYILRATMTWPWAVAVVTTTWALIVGADFAAAGVGRWALENSAPWTAVAALTGFYAYHCHVPGYWRWRAGPHTGSDSRRSAEGAQWQGWTAVGLVVVVVAVASIASNASAVGIAVRGLQIAGHSTPPASAPKKPSASWASFANGNNLTPTTLDDGLQITDVQVGTGTVARAGDVLSVRYIMWFSNGKQADSSDAKGGPLQFILGAGIVIQGWDEGVPGMRVEGIRRLVIPPQLAYGASGAADPSGGQVVPPNATLVFIIQLISDAPRT